MSLGPFAQFELTVLLGGCNIDSCQAQLLNVFVTTSRIDNVHGLLSAFEAVFDEWQQDTVLVIVAVEKGTDVALCAQNRTPIRIGRSFPRASRGLCEVGCKVPAPDGDLRESHFNPMSIGTAISRSPTGRPEHSTRLKVMAVLILRRADGPLTKIGI